MRNTCIGGDDLLGSWPPGVVGHYRKIVSHCGGKFSSGKAFFSPDGGNFTEMTFWVTPVKKPDQPPITWALGIPVRGLVDLSLDLEGEAYEAVGHEGGRDLRARRVLRALRPEAWGRCRSYGVTPCFPRTLGGAGLPPRRGSTSRVHAPKWLRLAVGKFLYGTSHQLIPVPPPGWVLARDPAALAARHWAVAILDCEYGYKVITYSKDPDPYSVSVPVSEWLHKETAILSQVAVFANRPLAPSRTGIAEPGRFTRALHRWARRTLLGGVPSDLAVSNHTKTRWSLVARSRLIRDLWHVVPLVDLETSDECTMRYWYQSTKKLALAP